MEEPNRECQVAGCSNLPAPLKAWCAGHLAPCDRCDAPLGWHFQACRHCNVGMARHRGQPPVCEGCKDGGMILNRAIKFLDDVKETLIKKNAAYGDSASNPVRIFATSDSVEQLKVRIDDKLSRIARGKGQADSEDVILDLVGYLALLAAAKDGTDGAS